MTDNPLTQWKHTHTFGQEKKRKGERRTMIVIAITGIMMIVEITSGILYGSLALLADGIHMGSHAVALLITAAAYIYARRQAGSGKYNFGTGKVNSLAGFSSAIILGVFALTMIIESVERFLSPRMIEFNQAILVAAIGLVVNIVSALFLNTEEDHDHDHDHSGGQAHGNDRRGTDHNLRSAYLHVVADALTSVLAIVALLGGKYFNLVWLDPMMGIVGAFLVARWSLGLIRDTYGILLDRQGPKELRQEVLAAFAQREADQVSDFHLWQIGPGIYAAILSIVSSDPQPVAAYKAMIPENAGIVHATIEVHEVHHRQH